MTQIKRIEKFNYKGHEYKSLPEIKSKVESDLGSIIDKMSRGLGIKHQLNSEQKLAILQMLVDNKDDIKKLLSVTYEVDTDSALIFDERNILDL